MSQPLGVSELVGVSMAGGSLKSETFRHSVVGAVGMAGATGKASYILGAELHRLRCASQAERWHVTVALIQRQVLGLARKGRWRPSPTLDAQIARMSEQALKDWLFDLCVPCVGRGKIAIELYNPDGTRKEAVCDSCGGKGIAQQKGRNMAERMSLLGVTDSEYVKVWDDRFAEVIGLLEKAYGVAQRAIAKRLARQVVDG